MIRLCEEMQTKNRPANERNLRKASHYIRSIVSGSFTKPQTFL
jgi:hypothetical protein